MRKSKVLIELERQAEAAEKEVVKRTDQFRDAQTNLRGAQLTLHILEQTISTLTQKQK